MFRTKDFSLETQDGVAIITIDAENESVNTLSPPVGEQFEQLLTRVAGDTSAQAIVFISGKKDAFIAGAKIEFLQSLKTQAEATHVFELCGGTDNDVHRLDGNKDGEVCESLP